LEIPSNKAPVDPIYNYKKAYKKYYKDNKDNEDDEEDSYRDGNNSQVSRGSQGNYPLQSPHYTFSIPLAVVNIYV
jgi:hypothetical protein